MSLRTIGVDLYAMRGGCVSAVVVATMFAGCTRPMPAEVPEEWSRTTIATYCEANRPCPPATLDLGTPDGDTIYGGVPAVESPACGDRRSEYRLARADIERGIVPYRR